MRILVLLCALGFSFQGFSQKKVIVSFNKFSSPDSMYKSWSWDINGERLSAKNGFVKVKINYPNLDTIYFRASDTAKPELMITRFNKGMSYQFEATQGTNEFDLLQFGAPEKQEEPKPIQQEPGQPVVMPDVETNTNEQKTYGTIQFKINNLRDSGLIIVSYGDIGTGLSNGYLVYFDSVTHQLTPFVSTYSDNTNTVVIGWGRLVGANDLKADWFMENPFLVALKEEGTSVLGAYDTELLRFRARFFNNENLLVVYDLKTGAVSYKVDKK